MTTSRIAAPRKLSKAKLLLIVMLVTGFGGYLLLGGLIYVLQDQIIYPQPAGTAPAELLVWSEDDAAIGYTRPASEPAAPRAVWLIFQGNGTAAGMRGYFEGIPADEAYFLMEYPGYGSRAGKPNEQTINAEATAAYDALRLRFPDVPIGVVGESFGSGPACALVAQSPAPDSVTLFVPLADFREAIGRLMRIPFARLFLRDQWDNRAALRGYDGPITIYAAEADEVLSRADTESLAASNPNAKLIWIAGGHTAPGDDRGVRLVR